MLLVGCGGGGDDAAAPPPGLGAVPVVTEPAVNQTLMRMHEAVGAFATLAASALSYTGYYDRIDGGCAFDLGGTTMALDGALADNGTALPAGNHTLTVDYRWCLLDGLAGFSLDGTATAEYSKMDPDPMTARVSATSLRTSGFYSRYGLYDVTVDGSGNWTRTRAAPNESTTFVPTPGSRLTDRLSTRSVTFDGGTYSSAVLYPSGGTTVVGAFSAVAIVIEGTRYVLDGQLETTYGSASTLTYAGEVRVTSNGVLAGRIYASPNGRLRTEVLTPLVLF